MSETVNVA